MLLCVMYRGMPSPLTPSSTSKWKSWNFTLAATNFAISADSESFVFLKHLFIFKTCVENKNIKNKFRTNCGFFLNEKDLFCFFWFFFSPFRHGTMRGNPLTRFPFYLYISTSVPIITMFEYLMHIALQGAALSSQAGLNLANSWAFIGIWVHI